MTTDVPDNKIYAGNPAKEIKSIDIDKEIRKREDLFISDDYDKLMKYLLKEDLKNNSFLGWIRALVFPKRGD